MQSFKFVNQPMFMILQQFIFHLQTTVSKRLCVSRLKMFAQMFAHLKRNKWPWQCIELNINISIIKEVAGRWIDFRKFYRWFFAHHRLASSPLLAKATLTHRHNNILFDHFHRNRQSKRLKSAMLLLFLYKDLVYFA